MRIILRVTILPRRFSDSRDLTFVCELSEADTANTVFTEVSVRSAADFAAVVFSCGILLLSLLLVDHRFLCHLIDQAFLLTFNRAVQIN